MKDEVMIFRLTAEEKNKIKKKAEINGYSNESEYIRKTILSQKQPDKNIYKEIHEAVYQLSKIGTNINQIAHKVNMNIYTKKDIEKIKVLLQNCNDKLREIFEIVGG